MRGKVYHQGFKRIGCRITPAYAGKSWFFHALFVSFRDHPRLCGEKSGASLLLRVSSGSPPPMRGKVDGEDAGSVVDRITPAYAGKSTTWYRPDITAKDHPRLCGEKPLIPFHTPEKYGITPAYAGKRQQEVGKLDQNKDHPRLCGEKWKFWLIYVSCSGSPPPMRGKVVVQPAEHFDQGITPAYAGKSFTDSICTVQNEDHPRLCGEKFTYLRAFFHFVGSPPPMRGKERFRNDQFGRSRITPAYAGKSLVVQNDTGNY